MSRVHWVFGPDGLLCPPANSYKEEPTDEYTLESKDVITKIEFGICDRSNYWMSAMRLYGADGSQFKEFKAGWDETKKIELTLNEGEKIVSAAVNHCKPSDGQNYPLCMRFLIFGAKR